MSAAQDNRILTEMSFDAEAGRLEYKGVRYLLVRPELIAELQAGLRERLGAAGDELLFRAGFRGGSLSAARFRQVLGLSAEETARFMAEMGRQIGWGGFRVDRFDPDRRELVLEVSDSAFAAGQGEASAPTCHLIRGVAAGIAREVFGGEPESRETACRALGAPACRFEVRVTG